MSAAGRVPTLQQFSSGGEQGARSPDNGQPDEVLHETREIPFDGSGRCQGRLQCPQRLPDQPRSDASLTENGPAGADPGVRRTLERRIRDRRARNGPDREAVFRQTREPGRLGLSDFAGMNAPGAAIAGQPPDRMLHRFRHPWPGFRHAEAVPGGESFTAPAAGLQAALRSLGGAPGEHRTDSLSAGFRNLCTDDAEDMTERCRLPCRRCGTTPSRNSRGIARGNGAIESPHGHLKREIADALALRGSADFADAAACRAFVAEIVGRGNARRSGRIKAERATLRDLPPMRTTDCEETGVDVAPRPAASS